MTRQEIYNFCMNNAYHFVMHSQSPAKIANLLNSTGLKFVGLGLFSVVFEHENYPGRVFKFSISEYDGYREYAKYCLKHQGEELIPTIYSTNGNGLYEWYELEKYYDVTKPELSRTGMVQFITPALGNAVKVLQYAVYGRTTERDNIKLLISTKGMSKKQEQNHIAELMRVSMIAGDIYSLFKGKYNLDIHNGNIMRTLDNKIIMTDPIASIIRITEECI